MSIRNGQISETASYKVREALHFANSLQNEIIANLGLLLFLIMKNKILNFFHSTYSEVQKKSSIPNNVFRSTRKQSAIDIDYTRS